MPRARCRCSGGFASGEAETLTKHVQIAFQEDKQRQVFQKQADEGDEGEGQGKRLLPDGETALVSLTFDTLFSGTPRTSL